MTAHIERIRQLSWPKPTCAYCAVTVDPRSKAFRINRLCDFCFAEHMQDDSTLIVKKKEPKDATHNSGDGKSVTRNG